jgi:8-oxo-dGTP pyrophosphatase MutT (NUDIX family)
MRRHGKGKTESEDGGSPVRKQEQSALIQQIRAKLQSHREAARTKWSARPAAVLVPLYWDEDQWHLLLTRRTDTVESHQGQVSFPGGMIEAGDSTPTEAALREAQEEIGVHPQDVEILGPIPSHLTVTQFEIVPILGVIPWPYALKINAAEVANTFGVPLKWLADPSNLESRFQIPSTQGRQLSIYTYRPYHGEVIWGATARIILSLWKY